MSGGRPPHHQQGNDSVARLQKGDAVRSLPELGAEIVDLKHYETPRKSLLLTNIHQLQSTVYLGREIRDTQGQLEARRTRVCDYCRYANAEQERQQDVFFQTPIEEDYGLQKADEDERAIDDRLGELDGEAVDQVRTTAGYLNQVLIQSNLVASNSVRRGETTSDVAFRDQYAASRWSSVEASDSLDASPEHGAAGGTSKADPLVLSEAQSAERDYRQQQLELERAQTRFDRPKTVSDVQAAAFRRRLEAGQEVLESIVDSDLHHYQRHRRLTREFIDAEERLAATWSHAVKLAVPIKDDNLSSGFLDDRQAGP